MGFWDKIKTAIADGMKMPDTIAEEERVLSLEAEIVKLRRKKTPKVELSAKDIATENGEPYISVLQVDVDKSNPRYGSFELDWNTVFIQQLTESGYRGESDEQLIDQWFQDVCRHVVLESYEQDQSSIAQSENVRYINRRPTNDGKTEVS